MQRLIGLDFDTGYLRMSVAETGLRRVRYLKSEGIGLPSGKAERDAAVAGALARWNREYGPARVVIGLPLQMFSCKVIEMPAMSRADMRKALDFELEKHLPLAVEEYLFDFITISAGKNTKAVVFAVRRDAVEGLLKQAGDAGMEVVSVRCRVVDVLASMRSVTGERAAKGLFVLRTDSAFEILCVEDALPAGVKRVDVDSVLADELEGLLSGCPGTVYCSGSIDQLTAERFNMRKFDVAVPNALIHAWSQKRSQGPDFIPQELVRQGRDIYPYLIGGLAAASVCIFLLTGLVAFYRDAAALRRIDSRISTIKDKAAGVIEARKKLDSMQEERRILFDFQGRSNTAIRALRDITKIVPDDSWIISLSIDEKGILELEGFSRKTSDLVIALEKSGLFRNISFSAPIISRDGEERFSLKLEVKEQ